MDLYPPHVIQSYVMKFQTRELLAQLMAIIFILSKEFLFINNFTSYVSLCFKLGI